MLLNGRRHTDKTARAGIRVMREDFVNPKEVAFVRNVVGNDVADATPQRRIVEPSATSSAGGRESRERFDLVLDGDDALVDVRADSRTVDSRRARPPIGEAMLVVSGITLSDVVLQSPTGRPARNRSETRGVPRGRDPSRRTHYAVQSSEGEAEAAHRRASRPKKSCP